MLRNIVEVKKLQSWNSKFLLLYLPQTPKLSQTYNSCLMVNSVKLMLANKVIIKVFETYNSALFLSVLHFAHTQS